MTSDCDDTDDMHSSQLQYLYTFLPIYYRARLAVCAKTTSTQLATDRLTLGISGSC